jgi:outer membrane protein TolC
MWVPTLSVGWTTAPGVQLKEGATWTDTSGALSLRLSYSLDSFIPWTPGREKVIEAEESVETSRNQLEETRNTSALKRENAFRLIRQAVQSLETQGLNVQLAQKTYDLSQDAYNRGTKDLLALQNSQGDLNQARYDLLSQRYTLISTVLDLEYELDVPFGTLLGGKK